MDKTLILIRHAHRDTTDRSLDNGLSGKGKEQAKALRRFFTERFSGEDARAGVWLVSSPMRRCLETLEPIARQLDRKVDIHPDLLEQKPNETSVSLVARVQRFLHEWSQNQVGLTVVCGHGDWLPYASHHLLGIHQEMKKGSWLEIDWQDKRAELKWYVPHFRYFYK